MSGVAPGEIGQGRISQRAEQRLWNTMDSSSKKENAGSHEVTNPHCQVWGSQQGSIIVMAQALPVFPSLHCNCPIYWMCVGLEGMTQFPSLWTKRNSIRLDEKDYVSLQRPGHRAEQRYGMEFYFDSLGRGLTVFYEWQEGHIAAACGRDCQLGPRICSHPSL